MKSNQDSHLVSENKDVLPEAANAKSDYPAEATEFLDNNLRMQEQPFENTPGKLFVVKTIYY